MADNGEPGGDGPDAGAQAPEPTFAGTFASSLAAAHSRVRAVPDQAGLAADERQRQLWEHIIRARYVVVALLGIGGLVPGVGVDNVWVGVGILLVGLPYTALYHWWLRRTGVLLPVIAISDQVLPVILVAFVPSLLAPALLFMLAITANTAISFGRRIAMQSAAIGFFGVCLVALINAQPNAIPALFTYAVLAGFTTFTVGAIYELERELRSRYSDLMGGIDAIVWQQLTQHPSTLYVNEEAEHLLGYPSEAWREPRMWSRTVHPDDRMDARRSYRDAVRRGISTELEYRMIAADGRVVWVQDHVRVETDDMGRTTGVRGVMLDISATRMAQEKANQFVNLVDGIKLALFVFRLEDPNDDDSLKVLAINPEAGRLIDIDPEQAVGRSFTDVLSIPGEELVLGGLADVVRTGEGFTLEEVRPTPKGHGPRIYTGFAFPLPGDAVGLSLTDITERTMAAEVLRRQALHDGLTGLPNRTLLNERMRGAIRATRGTDRQVALLVMDLDQFKDVNDALGHDQGDRLLIEVSRRLQKVLRDADTIARLGGDEFAVLVADTDAEAAQAVADQIRETLEQPFQLGGISLQTMGSIGIALYPDHADDVEGLAQRADVAMYSAKRSGVGVSLYSSEHDQSSVRRLALLGELRNAIADGELILHYQPSLELDTGVARSCEALVRWQHPDHGLMPPAEFIELAEVSGLIHPMTRWIIDQALTQIRAWLDQGIEMTVGVNLSVRNLYDRELVPWLSDLLIERGVDAHLLKLEVTESELMDDPLLALEVLGKLKALGTPTSIDDFGTGYSSLAYLKHLPIDELKIDKSFVGNMVNDSNDLTIVRSTIDLSHNLGMSVVAEGVEDGETLRRLADLGCDRAQGYFVSRPVPAERFTAWVLDPGELELVHAHLDLTSTGRGSRT